jgi:hypothetical protein
MDDEKEINIKLELDKDNNQNLTIITYFNPNSPNFFKKGDYYIWKPTIKEKEFIIDAFRLIIDSNNEKKEGKKIFKFSDKISEIKNDSENPNNSNIESNEKMNYIKENSDLDKKDKIDNSIKNFTKNYEKIINENIEKNKIKENKLSEEERERKIEKILRDNKKIDY